MVLRKSPRSRLAEVWKLHDKIQHAFLKTTWERQRHEGSQKSPHSVQERLDHCVLKGRGAGNLPWTDGTVSAPRLEESRAVETGWSEEEKVGE